MKDVVSWSRRNWLVLVLVVVIAALVFKGKRNEFAATTYPNPRATVGGKGMDLITSDETAISPIMPPVADEVVSESADRLVVEDTSVSLLVDDVEASVNKVQGIAEKAGGFLVSRNVDSPEGAASGTVSVRVPSEKRDETMRAYAELAVRVVSESVRGTDVTAEYEDVDAKLAVVLKTKSKLESLLDQATRVSEILEVQRELNNLQYQIDALQGRKNYLERAADLTRITVYLSTDELALPYTPDEVWRPEVVFKKAVRSLVRSSRELVNLAIWMVVHSPVWLSLILVVWLVKKYKK